MLNSKKSLNILLILLVIFVGFLVLRLVLTSQAIKEHNQYINSNDELTSEQLTAPIIQASDPWLGAKEPNQVVVAFENFTCPYCSQMSEILRELVNKYPEKVRVVWKDFVSSVDQTGLRSAVAARCAQAQGKFWEFHDLLFSNQTSLSDSFYQEVAVNLGLDENRFNSCFVNQETLPLVQDSFSEGVALGINGTPYLFVNDQRIDSLVSLQELEEIINK